MAAKKGKSVSSTTAVSSTIPKKKINGAKKGKAFEREWANAIGHIFPEAKRHLEYQADEASEGVDLENTDIFKFQLKNYQGYAPIGKITEIKKLNNGEVPVLITKGNRLPAMAVLPAEHFIHLLEVYYGLEPQKTNTKATINKAKAEEIYNILSRPVSMVYPASGEASVPTVKGSEEVAEGSFRLTSSGSREGFGEDGILEVIYTNIEGCSDRGSSERVLGIPSADGSPSSEVNAFEYVDERELSLVAQEHLKNLNPPEIDFSDLI